MIRSMTGFGHAELERDALALSAEVRTVNHKFCEVSVRLPRSLSALEAQARQRVQERLTRGKVNLSINWRDGREHEGELVLDESVAEQYRAGLDTLRARFGLTEPINLQTLVGLPDLFRWRSPSFDEEAAWGTLAALIDLTLDDLLKMREQEGQSLRADLETRVNKILASVAEVETRAPFRVTEAKEKLRTRITQLLQGEAEVPEERLIIEASFLADKFDCTEEVVRLKSHCSQFFELCRAPEPAGRRLNFLLQEMNREINTIGSKANDVTLARAVITLKEEVEVIREQVQNIE